MTLVAQVKLRSPSRADRAAGEALLVEIDRTKVFAVTTVLPSDLDGVLTLTLEIKFAQEVASIFTLDRALPGSEKSFVVLATEYSHFCSSV